MTQDVYNYDLTVEQEPQYQLQADTDASHSLQLEDSINVITVGHSTYIHPQNVASDVWYIEHKLGCFPSVTVVDSAETQVTGDVEYIDENALKVSFVAAFSGKAYLN